MPEPVINSPANLLGLAIIDQVELDVDKDDAILSTHKVRQAPYTEAEADILAKRALYSLINQTTENKAQKWSPKVEKAFNKTYGDQIAVIKNALMKDAAEDRAKAFDLIFALSRKQPVLFTEQSSVDHWVNLTNAFVNGTRDEVLALEQIDSIELTIAALKSSKKSFTAKSHYFTLPQWQSKQDKRSAEFRDTDFDRFVAHLEEFVAGQKELFAAKWQAELEEPRSKPRSTTV